GIDFSSAIRKPEGSVTASAIAQLPEVREFLVALFRRLIAAVELPGVVVEGRDITTVVAPDAQLRLLVTASESVRMQRRGLESATHVSLNKEIRDRDASDSKMVDFFNAAPGVQVIDTSDLSIDQVVTEVVRRWQEALSS
ncbi:MAG: (d)CMP kinase, partial [Microthrixaceae bacterium]